MALGVAAHMTLAVPLQKLQVPVALVQGYRGTVCASWWVPFMDMHTTACANWTGIHCTSKALEIRRAKVANMFSLHPMSWPEVYGMRHDFIDTKRLRNTSCFGIKTNTRRLVHIVPIQYLLSLIDILARFIHNHYREVMETIRQLGNELAILKATLNLSDDDFPWFLTEERAYLSLLKQPPPQDVLRMQYVQVLDDLEEKKYNYWPFIYI